MRDQRPTGRPCFRTASARMPSYFSSKTHSGPSTMSAESVASIGRGGTGLAVRSALTRCGR